MSEQSPAFQWYAAEYLSDELVQLMSLEEEGAYIRLLSYCWREGSIPFDDELLSRLCKGASTTVVRVVKGCFNQSPTDPLRMVHKRLEEEREKQRKWREKSAEGGRKSAKKRAERKTSNRVNPTTLQPPLQGCFNQTGKGGGTLQSSSSNNLKPLTPFEKGDESLTLLGDPASPDTPKVLKKEIADQAEKIYQAYPRKIGKPKALQAITRILKSNDFLTVLESTERYAKDRIGQDPTFTPHPATWFNQERFNDDPETWGNKPVLSEKPKDDRPQVIDRNRQLPDFFQTFLDQRPVYVERTDGRARQWKTESELPVSVRDDFDDWRGSYLRANKTISRASL